MLLSRSPTQRLDQRAAGHGCGILSAFRQIGPAADHSPVNPHLMQAHAALTQAGRIDAWFWGHEHTIALYAPYRGVAAGRNVGYGAVPVAATPKPGQPIPGLIDPPTLAAHIPLDIVDGAYTHGFAVLDLSHAAIQASYWALTRPDAPLHRETLASIAA